MIDDVSLPERLRISAFEAWNEEALQLQRELPSAATPDERWLQLVLLTNVLHSQYEIVLAEMDEVNAALVRISDADDPELPAIEEFTEWAEPWVSRLMTRFDIYRDERDGLGDRLSDVERKAIEGELDQRFDEIKERVKASLQRQIEALEAKRRRA